MVKFGTGQDGFDLHLGGDILAAGKVLEQRVPQGLVDGQLIVRRCSRVETVEPQLNGAIDELWASECARARSIGEFKARVREG